MRPSTCHVDYNDDGTCFFWRGVALVRPPLAGETAKGRAALMPRTTAGTEPLARLVAMAQVASSEIVKLGVNPCPFL